jgi:selenide,water dikinase
VICGPEGSEDAGVYRLSDDLALIQTIDFFTPIVDDPRVFGRAAAANSLSDIYAMGGRPVTAMNVVCFPMKTAGMDMLKEILAGGSEILKEAETALVGGHSVEDDEPKYGLSVSGLAHPDGIMRNSGLKPGQRLILTKAVGTGLIATAVKAGLASSESIDAMVRSMCSLNRTASEVAVSFSLKACTDVTGFGLAGHLVEMARASQVRITLECSTVPILAGAHDAASMGLVPAGAHANRAFFATWTDIGPDVSAETIDLMFDPQTSGGLILGVPADSVDDIRSHLTGLGVEPVAEIGRVVEHSPEGRVALSQKA